MNTFFAWCGVVCIGLPLLLWGQTVTVNSEINSQQEYNAFQQLQGTVTIVHARNQTVDTNSFRLGGKPLTVTLLSDEPLSSDKTWVLSTYQFTLADQANGLYVLPAVTVKVGGTTYTSLPSTYAVQSNANTPPQNQGPVQSYLELDLQIKGTPPFYPGQHLTAIYKFVYNNSIEWTEEILPLLNPSQGFKLVGPQQVRDYTQGSSNVHEISQELEAVTPGIYDFPQSKITGYVYMMSTFEGRIYLKPPLTAIAPAIQLTIMPKPS